MALAIQYDLFEEIDELTILRKEIEALRKSNENVRRGLFSRHNELMKLYIKQQEELDELKEKLSKKKLKI